MWILSRTLFLQHNGKMIALKNLRYYYVFAYFNFFFDCFLGMVSCALRVTKASIAALIYLPRLDYCIFGRSLEKLDQGFISYASFIHMECLHSHPVLIIFCSYIRERLEERQFLLNYYKKEANSREELNIYTRQRFIRFRWLLLYTLVKNEYLKQFRKHQVNNWNMTSAESFNEFLIRTVFKRFQHTTSKSLGDLTTKNQMTTLNEDNNGGMCTTLLLDNNDDQQTSKRPIYKTL
ncbi:unnamed protein product [Didymodactylos carnosus]|uniref:Uncharacterized protein n=2 Tax=Didymodactylos carnosus TaxID=1234261 RepID=A0A8S2UQY8_9BILA|nr:unnamed protein product [Didymodactylos carnosus]CAF4351594.1 unnamed protein product [Didymodactylos carnosus]